MVPEEPKKSCSLDTEENKLKCFSFQVGNWISVMGSSWISLSDLLSLDDIFPQSIFVTAASYGKKKLSRELCNGQKDSAQVYTDCLYDATDEVRYSSLVFSGKDI